MSALLITRGLTVQFGSRRGLVTAVDGLDLHLDEGGTLALVGESGCGKSATALALLGLHAAPPDAFVTGSVVLDGTELVGLDAGGWRGVRGRKIAMVFQEPMTALNPVFSIGDQIVEALQAHESLGRAEARRRAKALLDEVAIPDAGRRLDDYPHQLSGGQRQRALIAIAIAARPAVLIADEPTTALDVTIQAQILELLKRLKDERGMALILITHDLGVVADMADRVAVLYAGRKVEEADSRQLFRAPAHPYTRSLLASARAAGQGGRQARAAGGDRRHRAAAARAAGGMRLRAALSRYDRSLAAAPARRWSTPGQAMRRPASAFPRRPRVARDEPTPCWRCGGLAKRYRTRRGAVQAFAGVDLDIARGETVALVGGVRLRQDQPRQDHLPTAGGGCRDRSGIKGTDVTRLRALCHAAASAHHADGVPGPVRLAQSARPRSGASSRSR